MAIVTDNERSVSGLGTTGVIIPAFDVAATADLIFVGVMGIGVSVATSTVVRNVTENFSEDWDIVYHPAGIEPHSSGHHILKADFAAGSFTIVVTCAGSLDTLAAYARSFIGVNQAVPAGAPVTGTGAASVSATVTADTALGEVILDTLAAGGSTSCAVDANQTSLFEQDNIDAVGSHGVSTQAGVDGGVMSWTIESGNWALGAISFKPAVSSRKWFFGRVS